MLNIVSNNKLFLLQKRENIRRPFLSLLLRDSTDWDRAEYQPNSYSVFPGVSYRGTQTTPVNQLPNYRPFIPIQDFSVHRFNVSVPCVDMTLCREWRVTSCPFYVREKSYPKGDFSQVTISIQLCDVYCDHFWLFQSLNYFIGLLTIR